MMLDQTFLVGCGGVHGPPDEQRSGRRSRIFEAIAIEQQNVGILEMTMADFSVLMPSFQNARQEILQFFLPFPVILSMQRRRQLCVCGTRQAMT
jgi:hypothetical protein